MRGGWFTGFVALVLAGCGSAESANPSILIDRPEAECSDVTRALARAQGREVSACGPSALRFQNIVPLGTGHVLVWVPDSGEHVLWKLDAKGEFRRWPVSAGIFRSIRTNHVLVALPGDGLVFDYENQHGSLRIWKADVSARDTDPLPATSLEPPLLPRAMWSMTPVALDEAHMLEVRGSDGSYDVVRVADLVTRLENVGKNSYFRRGHRLVWLGAQRLLEWEPVSQSYRIWRYDTSRLPEGLFEPDPIAEGTRPEFVRENEIWVLADDQIGIWDRKRGVLRVRELDPLAADPLAGRHLNEISDDRFLSSLPGAEQPTTTEIRRLVLLFQDGRSFDSTFGNYCQAPAGSGPSCNAGPACCEASPAQPEAHACPPIDPSTSAYHALAAAGALADRYFASAGDDALTNLRLFQFGFPAPEEAGATLDTVGGLLAKGRVPYALYLLPENLALFDITTPHYADGSWGFFRTLDEFEYDVESEQLPQISVILPNGTSFSELPGEGRSLAAGTEFTTRVVRSVLDSPSYQGNTVVLVTHLLGGCSDHVPVPVPRVSEVEPDTVGYGGRVPFLALGPFVRRNHVSHVRLEHVSLSAFIEWNFLGPNTVGALGRRDALVKNLGDLFDPDLGIPIDAARPQP
jgi:hypothetical protein